MTVNATNTTANGPQFSLTEFGFGMVYNDSTAYFADLLNSDSVEYGNFTNTTGFSLETSSLLLPETQYLKFANLLAIATQGASSCPDFVGAQCYLPGTCESWKSTLGNFTFKIAFEGVSHSGQFLLMPLSNWMFDNQFSLSPFVPKTPEVCYIDVQPLPRNMPNSQSIIFGSDFFNSFTMLRQMGSFAAGINSMTLALSNMGQQSGAIINIYFFTPGPNPFTITPTVVQSSQIVNGMPTLKVNMTNGFSGQNATTPSFFFDMWANETFVFSSSCMQLSGNGTNSSASCSAAPVLANSLFNPTGDWEHPTTYLSQGGYNLQGNAVPQLLKFQDSQATSRFQQVYSVSGVIADTWLNNQKALFGQVGFGPMSPLSLQFIDPELMFQDYSIGMHLLYFGGHRMGVPTQNYTLTQSTDQFGNLYSYTNLLFGEIYSRNGVPFSAYF